MKYLPDSKQSIEFNDLRDLVRRGQLFALRVDYDAYSGISTWRAFAEVIRPSGSIERVLIGEAFSKQQELWKAIETALAPENPADHVHFKTNAYPFKVACGVGAYAKLCGIDWTTDLEEFHNAPNRCLKCWVFLKSNESK